MSRVAKAPVDLPQGVTATVTASLVTIKGAKGSLTLPLTGGVAVAQADKKLNVEYQGLGAMRVQAGATRAHLANMVTGVTEGFVKELEIVGVGYRATNAGNTLDLVLGYSHHYVFELPKEIKVSTTAEKGKNPTIILESIDKQLIGQVAAKIRSLRAPEPYKGKGIKFVGEVLRRKAGKSASKK